MTADNRPGLVGGYEQRDFMSGPKTYTDDALARKIAGVAGLYTYPGSALVGDLMSGPGRQGLDLQRLTENVHRFVFLDLATGQLSRIPQQVDLVRGRIGGDIRHTPLQDGSLDRVVVRYAIKDLPEDQQPLALAEIFRVLKPNTLVTVTDMVAPTLSVKKWLNEQHDLKQKLGLSPRDPDKEGKCHIPTLEEWLKLMQVAGFRTTLGDRYISQTDTSDWVNGKQITTGSRQRLNAFILNAPDEVKTAFNIREEENSVKIDYPVVILSGYKPYPNR